MASCEIQSDSDLDTNRQSIYALPPEVRDRIYSFVLHPCTFFLRPPRDKGCLIAPIRVIPDRSIRELVRKFPPLLQVDKQTRREVSETLSRRYIFYFTGQDKTCYNCQSQICCHPPGGRQLRLPEDIQVSMRNVNLQAFVPFYDDGQVTRPSHESIRQHIAFVDTLSRLPSLKQCYIYMIFGNRDLTTKDREDSRQELWNITNVFDCMSEVLRILKAHSTICLLIEFEASCAVDIMARWHASPRCSEFTVRSSERSETPYYSRKGRGRATRVESRSPVLFRMTPKRGSCALRPPGEKK